jgi:hypothetical protein
MYSIAAYVAAYKIVFARNRHAQRTAGVQTERSHRTPIKQTNVIFVTEMPSLE